MIDLDTRGLRCPLPVLRLRKLLADLPQGTRVRMVADDPMALVDVPHFCTEAGHEAVSVETIAGEVVCVVQRGG